MLSYENPNCFYKALKVQNRLEKNKPLSQSFFGTWSLFILLTTKKTLRCKLKGLIRILLCWYHPHLSRLNSSKLWTLSIAYKWAVVERTTMFGMNALWRQFSYKIKKVKKCWSCRIKTSFLNLKNVFFFLSYI